jgi:hypothetical protein
MIPIMSDNAAIWRQQAPGDRPLAPKLAVEPGFDAARRREKRRLQDRQAWCLAVCKKRHSRTEDALGLIIQGVASPSI